MMIAIAPPVVHAPMIRDTINHDYHAVGLIVLRGLDLLAGVHIVVLEDMTAAHPDEDIHAVENAQLRMIKLLTNSCEPWLPKLGAMMLNLKIS